VIATAHLLILLACASVAFYVCEPEELPPRRPRRAPRWGAYLVAMLLAPDAWAGPDPGKILPPPENCAPFPQWMNKQERYRCALGYFDRGCSLGDKAGCNEAVRLRAMRPEDLPDAPDPQLLQAPAPWWVWWRWWPVPVGVIVAWIWARAEQARARRRR